jgi:hypothetical protein
MESAIRLVDRMYDHNDLFILHVPPPKLDDFTLLAFQLWYSKRTTLLPQNIVIVGFESIQWATFSQVRVSWHLLELALMLNQNWTHVLLLSGDSYPLKHPAVIRDFLRHHIGHNLIEVTKNNLRPGGTTSPHNPLL